MITKMSAHSAIKKNVEYRFIINCHFKFSELNISIRSTDIFEIFRKPANYFALLFLSVTSVVIEEEFYYSL